MITGIGDRREKIDAEYKGERMRHEPFSDFCGALSGRDRLVGHFHFFCVDSDSESSESLYEVGFTDIVIAVE